MCVSIGYCILRGLSLFIIDARYYRYNRQRFARRLHKVGSFLLETYDIDVILCILLQALEKDILCHIFHYRLEKRFVTILILKSTHLKCFILFHSDVLVRRNVFSFCYFFSCLVCYLLSPFPFFFSPLILLFLLRSSCCSTVCSKISYSFSRFTTYIAISCLICMRFSRDYLMPE